MVTKKSNPLKKPATSNSKVTVSVCIANYNGNETLRESLDSVLGQAFEHSVEIIVHDDASTDNSVEFIRAEYPQVKLISSKKNVGFCISNNRMVAAAKGEFILLLNNDAALRKDSLSQLYAYAQEQLFNGILTLPQYNAKTGQLMDMGSLFDPFLNPVPNMNPARQQVGMVMGACLWIPQELWKKLEGFPEWIGSLAEDMYLCLRAWNSGYEVHTLSQSGYDHHVGHSFGGGKVDNNKLHSSYRRRAMSERNKTYIMVIFYPTPILVAILPIHLCLLLTEGFLLSIHLRSLRPWNEIYYPAVRGVFKQHKLLRTERQKIKKERQLSLTTWLQPFTPIPQKLRLLIRHGPPQVS
jgi:GT2 family glycosyltransferase